MINENKSIDRIGNAVGLITFGLIALLVSIGKIPLEVIFNFLFRFWPIFVIFGGLKLFVSALPFGKISNLILDILFNVFLLFTLLFFNRIETRLADRFEFFRHKTETVAIENLDVKASNFNIKDVVSMSFGTKIGATKFTLTDSNSPDYLTIAGSYTDSFFSPQVVSELKSGNLDINFKQNFRNNFVLTNLGTATSQIDFILGNNQLPISLDIDLGAGSGTVELTNKNIKGIKADVGAGKLTMTLPADQDYLFKYDVGAGKVTIKKGDEILKSSSGIGSDSTYQYGKESSKVVNVDVGAGSVDIILK